VVSVTVTFMTFILATPGRGGGSNDRRGANDWHASLDVKAARPEVQRAISRTAVRQAAHAGDVTSISE
jgi:hypothetical protein